MSERIIKSLGGGGEQAENPVEGLVNKVDTTSIVPDSSSIPNPLEAVAGNGVSSIVIQQVSSPPGVYYASGVGLFVLLLVVGLVYAIFKVRSLSEKIERLEDGRVVPGTVNRTQGAANQPFQTPGSPPPVTKEDYEYQNKPLRKRTTWHLIKTLYKGYGAKETFETYTQTAAPQPQMQAPMVSPQQPQMQQPVNDPYQQQFAPMPDVSQPQPQQYYVDPYAPQPPVPDQYQDYSASVNSYYSE